MKITGLPEKDKLIVEKALAASLDIYGHVDMYLLFKNLAKAAKNKSHLYQLWNATGYNRSVLEREMYPFHRKAKQYPNLEK